MSGPDGFPAKGRQPEAPNWIVALAKSLPLKLAKYARSLLSKIEAANKSLSAVWRLGKILVFIVVCLFVGLLVLRQNNDLVVVVEPFVLPDSLTSNGHSSAVFTDKMISELQRLLILRDGPDGKPVPAITTLLPDCITIRPFLEDLKRDYVVAYSYSTRIQAKREKMFYDNIADNIAFYLDKFGLWYRWKTVEVRGEVHQDGSLYRLTLTGTFREGSAYTSQTILSGDPSHFGETSGIALTRFAAPWIYVSTNIFKNYDQASDAIDMIHQEFKNENSALGLSLKGFSLLYKGKNSRRHRDVRSAGDLFDKALTRSPENYWALVGQAEANTSIYDFIVHRPKTAVQMSALQRAETDLKKAIQIAPANPQAYIQLSMLHWFTGNEEKSKEYKTLFLEKARERGEYFRAMTSLNYLKATSPSSKDQDEAEKEFKELTRTAPIGASEYSAFQSLRGYYAIHKDDWNDIRTLTGDLLRTKNWCTMEQLAYEIADASTKKIGLDAQHRFLYEADFLFSQMSEGGVSNFHFNNTWGETLASLGKYDQAIEKFKKALEHYGDHVRALGRWGQALMEKDRFNEAETKFRQSMDVEPTSEGMDGLVLSIYNQGFSSKEARVEQSRKLIEVFEEYERTFLQFTPTIDPSTLYAVSDSYCSLGNYERANEYINKIPDFDKNRLLLENPESCLRSRPNPR